MGTRKIGVAMDFSASSNNALKWTTDNLIVHGDTIILIHINPNSLDEVKHLPLLQAGSPLIPLSQFREPELLKQYDCNLDTRVLDALDAFCKERNVKVVAKLYWAADPRDQLLAAIDDLKLNSIVMGSRGIGSIQSGECEQLCDAQCVLSSDNCEIMIGVLGF